MNLIILLASILEELLESLKVQPSPVNIPSPQKAPETDDQLLSPATFKVSTDAASPQNQVHDLHNLDIVSVTGGPNWSLCVSQIPIPQDFNEDPNTDNMPESPIEAIPITAVPMIEKVQEVVKTLDSKRINPLKHTTLNDVSMSSCLHSVVQLEAPLSMDETKIWNLLFKPKSLTTTKKRSIKPQSCFLMPGDHVFCSPTHVELNKEVMQSLYYDKVVDIEVIRAWVDVLNFQELKRSSASPHRVFCPPNLISPWNLHDFSTDVKEKVESFSANLADYLDRIKINQHLKGVDLLLLPVEDSDSFYLMVFDLTNPSILVIDSFHSKKPLVRFVDSSDYYHKDSAYKMKTLVCAYLQSRSHQMSQRFKSMKISRVPIDWATSSYSIQNRIFLMRHMEKYYGQNKIFQCNFSKHGSQKNSQLNKLRNKYAAAIMLSEINILLPKIKSLLMS
ncbi:hypothetical protein SSX86_003795 [Deinandra increscens subsp. villosa]|uniref:Ubiquitin-like protease family profile domain-containing protein n=1 Tax=Deinandra increscens subsp. villosa TaxID=3103831 RepID=A0AAP0DJ09_9ASTR